MIIKGNPRCRKELKDFLHIEEIPAIELRTAVLKVLAAFSAMFRFAFIGTLLLYFPSSMKIPKVFSQCGKAILIII